jgi:hypothetical protein
MRSVPCSLGASVPEVWRPLQMRSVPCSLGASVPEVWRLLQGLSEREPVRSAASIAPTTKVSRQQTGRMYP